MERYLSVKLLFREQRGKKHGSLKRLMSLVITSAQPV